MKQTTEQKVKEYLRKIKEKDKEINSFLHLNEKAVEEAKEVDKKIKSGKAGKLAGKVIAVKSCINVKGLIANCGSKTLENYTAGYDATVIKRIREENGVIIGMTNMDEFACGSSGETSAFGATRNPVNKELIPGGTSSGSAAAVAAGFCDLALGTDTGGSVRNPASHCGIIGVKPSYGLVSRYGLIDSSMSLEQIGVLGTDLKDVMLLFNVIKGKDERDATTYESKNVEISKLKKLNIGIPDFIADKEIKELILKKVENSGFNIKKIKLPHLDLAIQAYYPIQYVEFFSGTRKFDGRRFGRKIEDSCGEEVLRRIYGGGEISKAEHEGKYYRKALQAKEIITEEFEKAFKEVDCIILPAVPKLPHKLGSKISVRDMYGYDTLTVPANLAGIPGIVIPAGRINNIPVGMQILTKRFDESLMFSVAEHFV